MNQNILDWDGLKDGYERDDQANIGHVGPEDVAEGEGAGVVERGADIDSQLRGAGPKSHDC